MRVGARSAFESRGSAGGVVSSYSSLRPCRISCMTSALDELLIGILLREEWRAWLALHELPAAALADELPVVHDHFAARHDFRRRALHDAAFVRVVVHFHVVRFRGQRHGAIRIPDNEIAVGSDGNRALLRPEA